VGGQELGRDGTRHRSIARTAIRRQVSGGEDGFNLMQPPEVRPHLRREIDERGNRSIACTFLPGPAQGLPHLPAGDGESYGQFRELPVLASGEWKFTTRYPLPAIHDLLLAARHSYGRPAGRPSHSPFATRPFHHLHQPAVNRQVCRQTASVILV